MITSMPHNNTVLNANIKMPFKVFSYSVDLLNAIAISASCVVSRTRLATLSERYFRCSRLNASSALSLPTTINQLK